MCVYWLHHSRSARSSHIKVEKGRDDNNLRNGILLRADVHALFDEGLIALTLDGNESKLAVGFQT
ncbi:HNH endonuclease [Bradyrhizobium sp. 143]|nr:HNH endonuclease [Bradyrhizobium sp. 143]MCK1725043.1 HNH endonuclease [Bradyrhizobium sp. 142]